MGDGGREREKSGKRKRDICSYGDTKARRGMGNYEV